jgi:DNA polymerase-3 subunit epsilon
MSLFAFGADLYRRLFGSADPAKPPLDTPYDQVAFLAVDIETTGLDPATDSILSIGYVPVIDGGVRLSEAGYHLVRPDCRVPEKTAVLHGLLEETLQTAPPLEEVLPVLLTTLRGRVGIAHHAPLEVAFLTAACRRCLDHTFKAPFVDTLALERRSLNRHGRAVASGELRLSRVRARYGLPRYRAHDALSDALGAAELFLAQAACASGRKPATLGDLMA